jgi:hypothetical protein
MATRMRGQPVRRRSGLTFGAQLHFGPAPVILIFALAAAGRAEQISDANLRFSMTIPEGFERMAQRPPDKPNWLYSFVKKESDGVWFAIVVERMRGTIGRERLDPRDAPAGSHARLHTVRWQGFDIDAIEFPEETGGLSLVNIKAQVPVKPEAIQISVVGPRDRRDESLALVNRLLKGFRAESIWLDSVAPRNLANSPHYGLLLLAAVAAGGIGGFAVLFLVTRLGGPRGTLAVLGGAVIIAALLMPHSRTREAMATSATILLVGVLGLAFGLVDLVREPKKKRKRARGKPSSRRFGQGHPGADV